MAAGRTRSGEAAIPEERLWQVGFVVGSVIGAAVTVAGRQIERSAREAGLVDWARSRTSRSRGCAARPGR